MPKYLISGDWHGDYEAATFCAMEAKEKGCNLIIQCGDFGLGWVNVDWISEIMHKFDTHVIWLDGNHENFDLLDRMMPHSKVFPNGCYEIGSRVLYSPRGNVLSLSDSCQAMTLGGGYSVDKQFRVEGSSWWPQETITYLQMRTAAKCAIPIDVMFTHDAPTAPPNFVLMHDAVEDEQNRESVRAVMEALKPRMLFHGHHHHRYETKIGDTTVVGLGIIPGQDLTYVLEA